MQLRNKIHLVPAFLLLTMIVCGSFSSCGNNGKEKNGAANEGQGNEQQVKDDTLKGFLLAGVYFVQGYGGAEPFFDKIKTSIGNDPSKAPFLTLLDSAYNKFIIYPYKPSAAEKVDSRNTLSEWFQINNQNDFFLFLNNLKDSGFQSHYQLIKKALDDHGGASADITKIDLNQYKLPKGSEVLLKFVKDNYTKFSPAGIKAWNIGLYVYIVTLGHAADYADAKTGKSMIMEQLAVAEKSYKDWSTYFSDFMLGREFSGVVKSENEVYKKTISQMTKGHYSMYTYMPL